MLTTGTPQSPEIEAKVNEVLTLLQQPKPGGAIHYLELASKKFRAIARQAKNFDIVRHDRPYGAGDILILQESPHSHEIYISRVRRIVPSKVINVARGWCALQLEAICYTNDQPLR